MRSWPLYEANPQACQCLGHQLLTNASIGIALAPQDGTGSIN